MSYRIRVKFASGAETKRSYMGKEQAMDAWDKATDVALPGDYLELLYVGSDGITETGISSYRPVGRVLK